MLIMGLMGAAVTTLLFGFSKSFAFALTMRALAGGLSGNAPVLQSVVGDITDKTNEVKAYSILAGGWSLAQISGPYIGYAASQLITLRCIEDLSAVHLLTRSMDFRILSARSICSLHSLICFRVSCRLHIPLQPLFLV